jgi:hypothetical protein
MLNNFYIRVDYEIMWENTVQPDRSRMKIYGTEKMQFACQITKERILAYFNNISTY